MAALGDLLCVKAVPLQVKVEDGSRASRARSLRPALSFGASRGAEALCGGSLRLTGEELLPPVRRNRPLLPRLRAASLEPLSRQAARHCLEPLPPWDVLGPSGDIQLLGQSQLDSPAPAPPRPAFEVDEDPWPDRSSSETLQSVSPEALALQGDAFSFVENCTPEDSGDEDAVETAGEDGEDGEDGDDEAEDWRETEATEATEAEDLDEDMDVPDGEFDEENEDGGPIGLAHDSDGDQPGATLQDEGQCDEEEAPRPVSRETPVVDELVIVNATMPVIIDRPKKKKKKKKRKKKTKRSQSLKFVEEVDKKPPVPRFPHPKDAKDPKEPLAPTPAAPPLATPEQKVPLRERFAKHLLLGRFPKRRPSVNTDTETEAEKPQETETEAPTETEGATATPPPQPRRFFARRKKPQPQPEPEPRRRREKEEPQSDAEKTSGLALVVKAMPRLRRVVAVPKVSWKEPVDSSLLSLGSLYFSFSSMRGPEGQKVSLQNRDKVVKTLHELNSKVAVPICRHFGLRFNFFSEHHPQAKKAGVTCKEPLILRKQGPDGTEVQETRYLVTIRLRLRLHPTKGDPQTDFISHGTQIAVLLHELCHLKHMNHGKDFMLFLRDIFAFACKSGVFEKGEVNEIPSPWPWENAIFQRAGDVSDEELLRLFAEHRAAQRQERTPDKEDPKEASEAISTSASDGARTPPPPPGSPRPPKALSLVSAFGVEGCADGCCSPPEGPTEIAYGEDSERGESRSGFTPSPCKLPSLAPSPPAPPPPPPPVRSVTRLPPL
ncbi:unnamed protein product [Effrenium voratum]|uniref:WLM domain-containing protein n=1 Tax=Effrenium voratum TaxID=2562239 RepID=A0AA36IXT1_9DINO|nr:unnamed protein product [Effrenium voratum]